MEPSKLAQVRMLLICIRKVPGSYFSWDNYSALIIFHGFPHSLQVNVGNILKETMIASFHILSSSSFIFYLNIQCYII
jgi:hypothetical protein